MQIIEKQRGMSLLAMTSLAVVVAIIALVFIKLFPVYMENGQIKSVMRDVAEKYNSGGDMSLADVRKSLDRRFNIEGVSGISSSDIEIVADKAGLALYLDYEKRTPLFSNIALVVSFQESAGNTDQ